MGLVIIKFRKFCGFEQNFEENLFFLLSAKIVKKYEFIPIFIVRLIESIDLFLLCTNSSKKTMDPKIKLSPEVIRHFKELQNTIQEWLDTHQKIPDDDELVIEFAAQKKKYLDLLKEVTTTLDSASLKTTESVSTDPIAQYYEMAVELGIQMGTGPNKKIKNDYQNALDSFFNIYELGNEGLQEEWSEAKKELEESDRILKEKIQLAQEELAKRRANTPPGGHFRFVEGRKGNETYYRLDWLSRMTDINSEAYHLNNNPDNHEYTAGTNRYLIEVYQANIDEAGIFTFTRNGSANSLSKKGLELFNMLNSPYLTLEETGNKKIPDLKYNETSKNTNNIPANILNPRDQLSVKAQNIADLISGQAGINSNQVTPDLTPGDTGTHMGNGAPFGRRVIITWINDGK